ncbi:MAG: sugar ABC transporter permease [Anaerolineae bacterium]|nr:sugar ABC transporter permease [Anaerolineae bacterium]MCB0203932.1 sugar ABC transporter permease [Anaerolineae bacterium]MCB0254914.1 sugar ABC transporter permease [Anaerolineae bacterium]
MWRQRWIYVLMAPTLLYFLIFKYIPLFNAQIAFKDFKPLLGVTGSPWVGLEHFNTFLNSFYFDQLITNTVIFSLGKLILGLPLAVILALALHETLLTRFRGVVQTVVYLPHFLSWVIMYGVLLMLLSPNNGLVNNVIEALGGKPIAFLTSPQWFRPVVILSDIWKETGWSTIIYLAALLSISPHLYEAATVDGASHLQRIWHISLPGIMPVIVLVTLLRLGHILDAGFNQIFMLYSVPVYSVGDIIDTWVYRQGILQFQFSLATAVGLFKGVIGLVLIVVANRVAKRITGQALF